VTFSYPKYLVSKRTVDERARHPGVWKTFLDRLRASATRASREREPVRILEVGGGVGDLALQILRALPDVAVAYTLIDIEPENLEAARERFRRERPDATVSPVLDGIGNIPSAAPIGKDTKSSRDVVTYFVQDDITRLGNTDSDMQSTHGRVQSYDAICGQAIMDIVPTRILLQKLSLLLKEQGVIYLPIHFDGRTDIDPPYHPKVDHTIARIYHDSMTRTWTDADGNVHKYDGSRSGRDLVMHAASAHLCVVDVGASDWIVLPSRRREGRGVDSGEIQSTDAMSAETRATNSAHYPAQEAYFLECMLHFFEGEIAASDQITNEKAEAWLARRRQQLADGDLAMFVHNLDVLLASAS
jgi:SAM-dependent methyltransferase